MRRLWAVAVALAAVVVVPAVVLPTVVLGAGNKLTNPNVSPTTGSTTTTFVFTVAYLGDDAATSVRAVAGSLTVTLSRVSGSATNGTWRASRTLPAGTWPFVFQATASGPPTNPSAVGPTVVVTGPTPPPTPTPRPTPSPGPTATPRPTTPPTPAPTPVQSAGASPTAAASSSPAASAAGTPTTSSSGVPVASAGPSAASSSNAGGGIGAGDDLSGQLGTILTGGLAAIGLLAVVGFAAIWRDRRRREEETGSGLLQPVSSAARPSPQPRALADWERDYAYDDEPIGTIEYHRPGDEV